MLLETLTPRQFSGWMAYAQLKPWGFDVDDARMGLTLALMAKAAGMRDVSPETFMFGKQQRNTEEPTPEQTRKDLLALFGIADDQPKPAAPGEAVSTSRENL